MDVDIGSPLTTKVTIFRALADPSRLALITALEAGEQCVCHLADQLDIAQPLVSHHLRTLVEAGLVDQRRDGRWHYYRLKNETLAELAVTIREHVDNTALAPSKDKFLC
ncbi:MAG: ArsR/SmtB family transcription factor [Ferrimicrobium sp.]